ncbi:forkhead box protein J1-B-like [Diadema setosum]|uniref:forkhead box protein J1-B-like n=1 Tax=Diadema setosum TaxID=31175 RepID=UPI003B3AF16D
MAAAKVATITLPLLTSTTRDTGVKFKQNWITKLQTIQEPPKQEPKEDNLDDSLTSLNWLQNLRIMRIQNPTPPSSPTPLSIQNSQKSALQIHNGGNGVVKFSSSSSHRTSGSDIKVTKFSTQSLHHHHHSHQAPVPLDQKIDYKTNSSVKPPYSYSTLIWMAMKESKKNKITLSSIYKWITENFKYYQVADPSWQNSIRHNLSLNKCFQKVPRKKDEPGKGGFWRIDPAHADELENGVFKKRRHNSFRELPIKIKTEPQSDEESSSAACEAQHHSRKQSAPKKRQASDHGSSSHSAKRARSQSYRPSTMLDDSIPSSVLKEDFSWNSIFESEIEVDGMRIKTEDILNGNESDNSDSLEMDTPPPSEHDSETVLDLSIRGTHIPRPTWFDEQFKDIDLHPSNDQLEDIFAAFDLPPSPAGSTGPTSHPWAEVRTLDNTATFNDLFDFGQLADGIMPWQEHPIPSP